MEAATDLHRRGEALAKQRFGDLDLVEEGVGEVDALAAGVQLTTRPDLTEDHGAREKLWPTGEKLNLIGRPHLRMFAYLGMQMAST